jgi:hypothetical protein
MSGFRGFGLLDVLSHPVADLPVRDGIANNLDEAGGIDSGRLKPNAIETLTKVWLIIRVQLPSQVQPDLINEPGQVHPAAHCFPGTAGKNNVTHASKDWHRTRCCQCSASRTAMLVARLA